MLLPVICALIRRCRDFYPPISRTCRDSIFAFFCRNGIVFIICIVGNAVGVFIFALRIALLYGSDSFYCHIGFIRLIDGSCYFIQFRDICYILAIYTFSVQRFDRHRCGIDHKCHLNLAGIVSIVLRVDGNCRVSCMNVVCISEGHIRKSKNIFAVVLIVKRYVRLLLSAVVCNRHCGFKWEHFGLKFSFCDIYQNRVNTGKHIIARMLSAYLHGL